MKKVSLIGATGSIGSQTVDVVIAHPDKLKVVALAAGSKSIEHLAEQVIALAPDLVSVPTEQAARELKSQLAHSARKVEIAIGEEGLLAVATFPTAEILVTAVVGFLGVKPTAEAVKLGKTIALANKETLVAAGSVIMPLARQYGALIIPVDSEHSAIHQCLQGYSACDLECIWLTASGGPFRTWSQERLQTATIYDALNHPNWSMGKKITIDSATLMNKGLELIEATWLFGLSRSQIEVVIHPQSILHSAIEFKDRSLIGQFASPDMRLPIHYALFYPQRVAFKEAPRLDLRQLGELTFQPPDLERFPCLRIAKEVAGETNTLPSVLNAANEVCVDSFLSGHLRFCEIATAIERVLHKHKPISNPALDDILAADSWARQEASKAVRARI